MIIITTKSEVIAGLRSQFRIKDLQNVLSCSSLAVFSCTAGVNKYVLLETSIAPLFSVSAFVPCLILLCCQVSRS